MIIFYFLILVMPLSQHHIWSQFVGDMTGFKFIGMACLPYALIHLLRRERPPSFFDTWQARFFIFMGLMATISQVLLGRADWWQSFWLTYMSMIILFFITVVVVDSLDRLRGVVLVAIGSLGLASLYVLRDWQMFHNVYRDYRPGWVVGDPNYFSVSALLFLPMAYLMLKEKGRSWQWMYCLGCLVLTVLALMVSASRGGFLGMTGAALYIILRSRGRIRNLAIIIVGMVLLTVLTPFSPWDRFANPTSGDTAAVDTRVALWHAGMRMVEAHPFLGVGLGNFKFEAPAYVNYAELPTVERAERVAHNSYVEIVAELGLPGLATFLAILISAFFSLEGVGRRASRAGIQFVQQVAFGSQAGLIGAAIAIFFVSAHYLKLFWLAIFISMVLPSVCEQAESEKAQATEGSDRRTSSGEERPLRGEKLPVLAGAIARRVPLSDRARALGKGPENGSRPGLEKRTGEIGALQRISPKLR
jgi:O-antigen ligase